MHAPTHSSRLKPWLYATPPLLFLAVFLVLPLAHLMGQVLGAEGAGWPLFAAMAASPVDRAALGHSLLIAGGATVFSLALALPYALGVHRLRLPGAPFLQVAVWVPLLLPPFAGALAMRQLFGPQGTVNLLLLGAGLIDSPIAFLGHGLWGCMVLEGMHLFPILYFFLAPAIEALSADAEEAGRMLGPKDFRFYRRLVWPQLRPAVIAGCTLVFAWAFTDLGTPLMLEYRDVLPYRTFALVNELDQNPKGYALAWVLFAVGLAAFAIGRLAENRLPRVAFGSRRLRRTEPVSPWLAWPLILAMIFVIFITSLPLLGTVLLAVGRDWVLTPWPQAFTGAHLLALGHHRLTAGSIQNSLLLASLATLLDLALGLWLARISLSKSTVLSRLAEGLALSPLLLPGILMAFSYVGFFTGSRLDPAQNPMPLLVAAYAVRRLPFAFKSVQQAWQALPASYDEAARLCGAGFWRRFTTLHLPLASTQALAACLMVFAFSMLEVSDSLVLAGQEVYYPLTKTVYFLAARIGDGQALAAALSLVGVAVLLFSLAASAFYLKSFSYSPYPSAASLARGMKRKDAELMQ